MATSPKKVLFVITKSNWGGAQKYVFDLATHLPHERFEAVVALGGTGGAQAHTGPLAERLAGAGIRTIFVESFMRDMHLGQDVSAFFELVRIFKKERPDVVHLNSSKAGGLGALAARITGVPTIIFTSHGLTWDEARNPLARALIYLATRATFLLCHKVITISQNNYQRAGRCLLCRNKIYLIHNGVGPMEFGSGESVRAAFPPGATITGTVGELTHNKNQVALIEEARTKPDMYVAIVGEGELRAMLQAKIKEYGLESRVKLFGFKPAAEVLKGFDVFALPSRKEGLPYVLIEARMAGLPIIANRVGGIPDIIDAPDIREFSLDQMVAKTAALYS